MKKYGVGDVLPEEDEEQRKTAASNWDEQDRAALEAENATADGQP
jgi:hypothetical protein